MEEKEYEPPVIVTGTPENIVIDYGQSHCVIPRSGPVPDGTPSMLCRVYEAVMHGLRAE